MSTLLSVRNVSEDDPAQAEVMKIRSELMRRISQRIADEGWGPEEAEGRCGLTVTGLTSLLAGMIEAFSLEDLIRIGVRVGLTVRIAPEPEGR